MQVESTLLQNLSNANDKVKAAYDKVCKEILSNRYILGWILKSCVWEFSDYDFREIAEKYIEGTPQISALAVNPDEKDKEPLPENITGMNTEDTSVNDQTVYYDIRFKAIVPSTKEMIELIINLEAQQDFHPGYPIIKRGIYYGCRMISSQYETEFTKSHYEKIKKVYSIWICMDPTKERQNTINTYSIKEDLSLGNFHEKTKNFDLMTIVLVCLGDSEKLTENNIIRLLSVLFSNEKTLHAKREILEQDFAIPMTREIEEEMVEMCNFSDGVELKGIRKGIFSSIINLINSEGWSLDKTMSVLQIPDTDKDYYREQFQLYMDKN